VNRLEKVFVSLPNGTFFEIVSSKPLSVMLLGGRLLEEGQLWTSIFYTSLDGGYVGKEFVFMQVGRLYHPAP